MKWPLITFGSSIVAFTFLLGLIGWRGTDDEYRYYTAIRMHACDIFKNNQATLHAFKPENCLVTRRHLLVGQLIDVTCTAENDSGERRNFDYHYSNVHTIYDALFKRFAKGQGQCNG